LKDLRNKKPMQGSRIKNLATKVLVRVKRSVKERRCEVILSQV